MYWYLVHTLSSLLSGDKMEKKDMRKEEKFESKEQLLLALMKPKETVELSDWEKKLLWSDLEASLPDYVPSPLPPLFFTFSPSSSFCCSLPRCDVGI